MARNSNKVYLNRRGSLYTVNHVEFVSAAFYWRIIYLTLKCVEILPGAHTANFVLLRIGFLVSTLNTTASTRELPNNILIVFTLLCKYFLQRITFNQHARSS